MRLLSNNKARVERDRKFMPLRILGIISSALFFGAIILCAYFLYVNVYMKKGDIQKLLELQTLGLPHTIQFERLERVEDAWNIKRGTKAPTNLRNPFAEGVPSALSKTL